MAILPRPMIVFVCDQGDFAGADLGGRVQGLRNPPPSWDDLRLSNTTGILPKKIHVVYWCRSSGAPPPKKDPGYAPVLTGNVLGIELWQTCFVVYLCWSEKLTKKSGFQISFAALGVAMYIQSFFLPYLCLLPVFHERRFYPGCCYWYHPSWCFEAFVFSFLDAPCWLLRCVHERWRALEPMLSMFVIFSHRLLYVNEAEQLPSRLSFCKCTHSRHEDKFGFYYCLQIWGRSFLCIRRLSPQYMWQSKIRCPTETTRK